jgi:general nucleoside transport system ATP-binding protein
MTPRGAPLTEAPPPQVEAVAMSKTFGALRALDRVSLSLAPGAFHAILGENGAGKSTLVKCIMGHHRPDSGHLLIDGVRHDIRNPRQAHRLGLGLVYQHFTLVPSMTAAENLVLGENPLPAVIDWDAARERAEAFQRGMPLRLELNTPVTGLAAGEKQKLEILKQLYLGRRVLILDEPTSVLTPGEADQVLGMLRDMAADERLSVVLITHKLREVLAFARHVSVLRSGRLVGEAEVAEIDEGELTRLMFGRKTVPSAPTRRDTGAPPVRLEIRDLTTRNDKEVVACQGISLAVHGGEILGVAGVAGNGQRELVEVLAGQREAEAGEIRIGGAPYRRSRREMRRQGVFLLTEEPLHNGCVRRLSIAENLAIRNFDSPDLTALGCFLRRKALRAQAIELIGRFGIRTPSPDARIDTLSGGNVQRTALARELSGQVSVLIAQNPCVGLDFAATSEIRARLVAARNGGAAILLFSEDLDELIELADRIVVMFEGRIVYETGRAMADRQEIGRHMASRQSWQRAS